MARVHLFSSLTSTPHSRHSPSPEYDALTEDPALPSKDSESHNITISVTQEEGTQVESSAASPSTKNIENDNTTSSEAVEQEKTALTNELTSSSAALTAALLQNAHGNNDMAGAVAAALSSVKPESFQGQTESSSRDKPEEVMDQAAAATALQLLGLSHSNDEDKEKEKKAQCQAEDSNVMLIANYSGLTSNLEDIDLSSEDLMQDYKRGTWTREEDELLLSGIKKFGYGRWKEIATAIPGRKGKQLKQRWDNTLAAKYVDQEWLRNKIRTEELHHQQQQQQQQQQQATSSTSTMEIDKSTTSTDDKALKFLESTDWNDIALKISEKAREGDQHAIEALLSQALLGTVAHATNTSAATTSAATTNNHSAASSPIQNHDTILQHSSGPQDSNPSTPSATTSNANDALGLNFTRSPIDPNHHPPPLNYADATALALYATQLSQHNNNNNNNGSNNASNNLHLAGNQPFFNPFGINTNDHQAVAEAAAATAAAVAAVAAQQQRNNNNYPSGTTSPGSSSAIATTSKSIPVVGQKRRRSDPALADTQSAAMTIYASATPITTTINNQTQTVYPCLFPNCGKTFARLYNLKSHSRTHTDDRPFVCHACSAAFSRNHDLKRHSKIHGGDKPYKCEGCKKSFSRLDALKRHKSNQRNKQGCTDD